MSALFLKLIIFEMFLRKSSGLASAIVFLTLFLSFIFPDEQLVDQDSSFKEHFDNSKSYYDQGLFDSAYYHINQAILINPESAEAYFRRALVQQQYDSLEQANEDYKSAISIDPKPIYYNNIGTNLSIKGAYEEAINYYNGALLLDKFYANAVFNRGIAYYYMDSLDLACIDAKEAKRLGLEMAQSFIKENCH